MIRDEITPTPLSQSVKERLLGCSLRTAADVKGALIKRIHDSDLAFVLTIKQAKSKSGTFVSMVAGIRINDLAKRKLYNLSGNHERNSVVFVALSATVVYF